MKEHDGAVPLTSCSFKAMEHPMVSHQAPGAELRAEDILKPITATVVFERDIGRRRPLDAKRLTQGTTIDAHQYRAPYALASSSLVLPNCTCRPHGVTSFLVDGFDCEFSSSEF